MSKRPMFAVLELETPEGKLTGKFHMCCINPISGVYAVGYCAQMDICPECKGQSNTAMFPNSVQVKGANCERCNGAGTVEKENPCPGHDTREAAAAHFKDYLLDSARYDVPFNHVQNCEICNSWTKWGATMAPLVQRTLVLCNAHRRREKLSELIGDVVLFINRR